MSVEFFVCKECGETFKSERSLHAHIKKHNLTVAEYYTKFYPRYNMQTGEVMPFKSKKEYFSKDFSSRSQMKKWISSNDRNIVGKYIYQKLKKRIEEKGMNQAPCYIDLELSDMPPLESYRAIFGSYTKVCDKIGIKPMHATPLSLGFFEENSVYSDMEILIDTREQKPLKFISSKAHKLDFGDYTVGGEHYSYTYIDRKSEPDFKSTFSVGLDRFKRELERAREFNSFMYVLIEGDIESIKKNNVFAPHKSNLSYIWHNTKMIAREYCDVCQVLFSGGRRASEFLVPRLLKFGKSLWNCDVQYYIDKRLEEKKQ